MKKNKTDDGQQLIIKNLNGLELLENLIMNISDGERDIKNLGRKIYEILHDRSGLLDVLIIVSEYSKDKLVINYIKSPDKEDINLYYDKEPESFSWYVMKKNEDAYLPDNREFAKGGKTIRYVYNEYKQKPLTVYGVPLRRGNKVQGVILFQSIGYDKFDEIQRTILKLMAKQIEIALFVKDIINELDCQKEKYREISIKDPLTKAYSRHYFNEWILKYSGKIKNSSVGLWMVMIDINKFKQINDTLGHLKGDEILINVVEKINLNLKSGDRIVRYGGDEFIIMFKSSKTFEGVQEIMQKIQNDISSIKSDFEFPISISYGITLLDSNSDIYKTLKDADEKMYEMKKSFKYSPKH